MAEIFTISPSFTLHFSKPRTKLFCSRWVLQGRGSPTTHVVLHGSGVAQPRSDWEAESKVTCNLISCWWSCWIYECLWCRGQCWNPVKSPHFFLAQCIWTVNSTFFLPSLPPFPSFPLRGKLEGWVVCSPSVSAFQYKDPFCLLVCFWLLLANKMYLSMWVPCVCLCIVCRHMYTKYSAYDKRSQSPVYRGPQTATRCSVNECPGVWWDLLVFLCVFFCFVFVCLFWRQSEFSTTLPFSPLVGERVASPGTIHIRRSLESRWPSPVLAPGHLKSSILENLEREQTFARWRWLGVPGFWHQHGGPF